MVVSTFLRNRESYCHRVVTEVIQIGRTAIPVGLNATGCMQDLSADFSTPEGARKVVKLKAFSKFENTTEALAAAAALVDSKLSKGACLAISCAVSCEDCSVECMYSISLQHGVFFTMSCHDPSRLRYLLQDSRSS